jgi:hypothetical protein
MVDELEALVGYVFIVGGRAVSATPPGALVELPPRKAPRGREQDTFFTLVTPSGAAQANAGFYEQMAKLAAELYFRSSGSVTSGLREAINGVNAQLLDHNQIAGQRYALNIGCLVLRGHEVFTARTGECLCLLRQGDDFSTYPEKLNEPYAGPVLGHSPVLDIKLSRHEVMSGHVMVLSDPGFGAADRDRLGTALGQDGIQNVLEQLKRLGSPQAQAMTIQFTSAGSPDPVLANTSGNLRIIRSSNAPTAKTGMLPLNKPKARTGDLPIVMPTLPPTPAPTPVTSIAVTEEPAPAPSSTPVSTPVIKTPTPLGVSLPAIEPPPASLNASMPATVEDSGLMPITELTAKAELTAEEADQPAPSETEEPPPEEDADSVLPPKPISVKVVSATANVLEKVGKGMNRALDRMLPEATENGPKIPSMLAAALAILIPVVVVFVIVAARLSQIDTSQFEQMVHSVVSAAEEARTIPLEDEKNARTAWLGVMQRIEDAENTTGRTNDPTLAAIRGEAQGILDRFARVTRRVVTPLRGFDGAVSLKSVVIRAQTDMYTLDVANAAIWHDRLNPNDKSVVRRSSAAVVVKGQAVSSFSVRNLVDMAWMADGSSKNRIVALDSQGILVTYSPVFAPATAVRLTGVEQWSNPIAMTVWRDRLYVLDIGANQIWRYTPVGSSYPNQPDAYFETAPDLSNAIDLAIDSTPGNVYVLFANGAIKKYLGGVEQPFSYTGLPEDSLKEGAMMYLDADSTFPAIYVVDPRDLAIYQFTLRGQFQHRFKAADTQAFRNLTSVYVDGDDVYLTTSATMYYFSMADVRLSAPSP